MEPHGEIVRSAPKRSREWALPLSFPLHTKEKRKFLVGMTATSRMELSNLLPSTSQHAKACARNA